MKKKTKTTAAMPDQPLLKDAIEPQMFVESMRRLLRNDDFKLLRRFWASERIGILEGGKSKPSESQWSVLKGFDAAIVVAEIWAHKQTGDDLMRKRHEDLMNELNLGDKTK